MHIFNLLKKYIVSIMCSMHLIFVHHCTKMLYEKIYSTAFLFAS
jgi:hypothetical protein